MITAESSDDYFGKKKKKNKLAYAFVQKKKNGNFLNRSI